MSGVWELFTPPDERRHHAHLGSLCSDVITHLFDSCRACLPLLSTVLAAGEGGAAKMTEVDLGLRKPKV